MPVLPLQYKALKEAAAVVPPLDNPLVELHRLRKETAELVERHTVLSDSAVVVANRADAAEADLAETKAALSGTGA